MVFYGARMYGESVESVKSLIFFPYSSQSLRAPVPQGLLATNTHEHEPHVHTHKCRLLSLYLSLFLALSGIHACCVVYYVLCPCLGCGSCLHLKCARARERLSLSCRDERARSGCLDWPYFRRCYISVSLVSAVC